MDDRTIIIRTFEGTVHTESDRLIFIQNGLYVECGAEQSPAACPQRYFSFIGELGCFGYYVDYSACTSEVVSDTLCDGCGTFDDLYAFYSLHFG